MRSNFMGLRPRVAAVWAVSIVMMIVLGFSVGYMLSKPQQAVLADRPTAVRSSGYTYINPLLECELAEHTIRESLLSFKGIVSTEVEALIDSYKLESLSVYFRDLNNGIWFGIHDEDVFSPASLLKVPLLMATLRKNENSPGFLDEMVENNLDQDFDLRESIVSNVTLEPHKQYKVKELLDYMITNSSNNAALLLANKLSVEDTAQTYSDLGVPKLGGTTEKYTLSVKQYASFFRVLFNASYLSRELSEEALKYLSFTKFRDGLVAGVPEEVVVSHKFGERAFPENKIRQLHDCGIVYYPNHPYLICIMTKGNNPSDLAKAIARISSVVYHEVDAQVTQSKK